MGNLLIILTMFNHAVLKCHQLVNNYIDNNYDNGNRITPSLSDEKIKIQIENVIKHLIKKFHLK